MFKDAWLRALTSSAELCLEEAQNQMTELMDTQPDRQIMARIWVEGQMQSEECFDTATEAYDFLVEHQQEDQQTSPQPRTLVSFVANHRKARNRASTCKGMSFAVNSMAGILEDSDEESEEEDSSEEERMKMRKTVTPPYLFGGEGEHAYLLGDPGDSPKVYEEYIDKERESFLSVETPQSVEAFLSDL